MGTNKLLRKFLLLCGFENFKNFYIRIDILEKLFIKILSKSSKNKFKIDAEMMNLLGCSKEDFFQLMEYMNYKKDKKDEETYLFMGEIKKKKRVIREVKNTENPFSKLKELNIK